MNENRKISPHQFTAGFVNDTLDNNCNVSFCEKFSQNDTRHTIETTRSKERSLGFLVIGIIGVVANSFVIQILGSSAKIRQTLVNTLIIHQSFVDLLTSVLLIGTAHIDGLDQHGLDGFHADVYCFFLASKWPLWVMIDVSSFSLVFLNIERYISIVNPIYHHIKITRKKVLTLLPIVWFLGLLEQCFLCSSFESENGACVFGNPGMFQITVITFLILHFFLPVVLVLFLYGHMFLRLKSSVNSGSDATSGNRNDVIEKAKKNVFKTMLFITMCYAVCYVFNRVYVTLVIMGILENISGK